MRKAINIEFSSNDVVGVLSITDETILSNNPTGLDYFIIEDYVDPPTLETPLSKNYAMYDKVNGVFKWVQIHYQTTATDEIIQIENLKKQLIDVKIDLNSMNGNMGAVVTTVDNFGKTLFPTADKTNLEAYKEFRISESKSLLVEYLQGNPLTFTDGKKYSVTAEKQTLLANAIQVYQLKLQSGITPILKWNATGEECTEWTIENLTALALAIANYVEPLVSKQQLLETQIKACTTAEELDAIVINYETI